MTEALPPPDGPDFDREPATGSVVDRRSSLWQRFRVLHFAGLLIAIAVFGWLLVRVSQAGQGWDPLATLSGLDLASPWALGLFIPVGVLAMLMFTPKTAVSMTAGTLFGTVTGCLAMLFVALISASIGYLIGRAFGRWFRKPQKQLAVSADQTPRSSPPSLRQAMMILGRDAGVGVHLLVRLAPIPTGVISYSMGIVGAKVGPFLIAAVLGLGPQFLYVHAASALLHAGENAFWQQLTGAVSLTIAVAASLLLPPVAIEQLKQIRSTVTSERKGVVRDQG